MNNFQEDIKQAIEVLNKGGIILYPTDTIWGIGCDATNQEAVQHIYELKKRIDSKSMLVLMDSENKLQGYLTDIPEITWDLLEFADKPMTIIYPYAKNLAENLIAEDGSIGIRVSKDNFNQQLIGRFKKPIVSTSANISGESSPAKFDEISDEIKAGVDYITNWRQDDVKESKASQIIKFSKDGSFVILRE